MGGSGPSDEVKSTEQNITQQEVKIANAANQRADKVFSVTEPGLETAESYYKTLASGDTNAIFRAIAPAAQEVSKQYTQAEKSINSSLPRGGTRDLALAEAKTSEAGDIGHLASSSFLSAFPALANLSGTGLSFDTASVSNAISAFGGASNTIGNLGSQQEAGKAASMGLFGGLAGAGGELGSSAIAGKALDAAPALAV